MPILDVFSAVLLFCVHSVYAEGNPVCGKGVTSFRGQCLALADNSVGWKEARENCLDNNMELVRLDSEEITREIDDILSQVYLHYEKLWTDVKWVNGDLLHVSNNMHCNTTDWIDGFPQNSVNGDCVIKMAWGSFVEPCKESEGFGICQGKECPFDCDGIDFETKDPPELETCPNGVVRLTEGEHCYYVEKDRKVTWKEAQDLCRNMSGKLLNTNRDTELLDEYIQSSLFRRIGWTFYWVGGHRTSTNEFYNDDGEVVEDGRWYPGEPNDYGGNEDCVQYSYYLDTEEHTLNDNNCIGQYGYICDIPNCPSDCSSRDTDNENTESSSTSSPHNSNTNGNSNTATNGKSNDNTATNSDSNDNTATNTDSNGDTATNTDSNDNTATNTDSTGDTATNTDSNDDTNNNGNSPNNNDSANTETTAFQAADDSQDTNDVNSAENDDSVTDALLGGNDVSSGLEAVSNQTRSHGIVIHFSPIAVILITILGIVINS